MKFPVGKTSVSTLPSAQQSEIVGRARANARSQASAALNRIGSNQTSAAQHCKQTLPMSATGNGTKGLQHIKSQSSASWTKTGVSQAMQAFQGAAAAVSSHRVDGSVEFVRFETLDFVDGGDHMSPQTNLPAEAKTPAEKPPIKPTFPELNFFSAPPEPQKIGVIEVQKPQRAVFKNTQPVPDLAASRMPIKTLKLDPNTELAQGKMRVTKLVPELAASIMRINTVKIDPNELLAQGKLPVTEDHQPDKT
jgi:hypothetical protein